MVGFRKGQKFMCRICNKSCVSGKSLGGHMRVHLALLSSSKSTSKQNDNDTKLESKGDDQNGSCKLEESSKNQIYTTALANESLIGDPSNGNYELRENPKKSWRFPDSRNTLSCRQCGKEFASRKAVSGHMRSHSHSANNNAHVKGHHHKCRHCGKVFGSMRAMFGHMKCHSKRISLKPINDHGNGADRSMPELKNLCHVRRKRSQIKYKTNLNPNPNPSHEEQEVAECLIMLSSGVMSFESLPQSSDDIKNSAAAVGADGAMDFVEKNEMKS